MRTCFTTVASSLWVQRLIVTVHRVRHLTMGPCLHNAGIGDCRRRSRNVLLSLILHSPGLLIQGKPLNHDCVPSSEAAKFPCLKRSRGFWFLNTHYLHTNVWVPEFISIKGSFHLDPCNVWVNFLLIKNKNNCNLFIRIKICLYYFSTAHFRTLFLNVASIRFQCELITALNWCQRVGLIYRLVSVEAIRC